MCISRVSERIADSTWSARRDALGNELLELRVEVVNAGHVAGSGGEAPNALPVAVARGLRKALPHRVRRFVAARASGKQVPRARLQGSVLETRVKAALHRALPADMAFALRLRGSRAAQHVGALDAERVQLLLGKQRRHADGDGCALQNRDVAALDHGGEAGA
jgi:hypothetical protein